MQPKQTIQLSTLKNVVIGVALALAVTLFGAAIAHAWLIDQESVTNNLSISEVNGKKYAVVSHAESNTDRKAPRTLTFDTFAVEPEPNTTIVVDGETHVVDASWYGGDDEIEGWETTTDRFWNMDYVYNNSQRTIYWQDYLTKIKKVNINKRITPRSISGWFNGMTELESLDLTNIATDQTENYSFMIFNTTKLTQVIGLEDIVGGAANDVEYALAYSGIKGSFKLEWDTSGCSSVNTTFAGLELDALDLSLLDVSNVGDFGYTFRALKCDELDLTGWDFSGLANPNSKVSKMFDFAEIGVIFGDNTTPLFSTYGDSFEHNDGYFNKVNCAYTSGQITGGYGSSWLNPASIHADYLRIDKGVDEPGMCTPKIEIKVHDESGKVIQSEQYRYGFRAPSYAANPSFVGWACEPNGSVVYAADDLVLYDINDIKDIELYPICGGNITTYRYALSVMATSDATARTLVFVENFVPINVDDTIILDDNSYKVAEVYPAGDEETDGWEVRDGEQLPVWEDQKHRIIDVKLYTDIHPRSTYHWFENLNDLGMGGTQSMTFDLTKLYMDQCVNAEGMFGNNDQLDFIIGIGDWDMSKCKTIENMFFNATIKDFPALSWDLSNCDKMKNAFNNAVSQEVFDLSGCTFPKEPQSEDESRALSEGMFSNNPDLTIIYTSKDANISSQWWLTEGSDNLRGGLGSASNAPLRVDGEGEGVFTPKIYVNIHDRSDESLTSELYSYGYKTPTIEDEDFLGWSISPSHESVDYYGGSSITYNKSNIEDIDLYPVYRERSAFAVFSDDDKSLSFYHRFDIPSEGAQFEGKTVSNLYTDIDKLGAPSDEFGNPWSIHASTCLSIEVVDKGISPASTQYWFFGFQKVTSLELNNLDVSKTTDMSYMFQAMFGITTLDLTEWNTKSASDMTQMFFNCRYLETIYASDTFSTDSVNASRGMFTNCQSLVGGQGTVYSVVGTDCSYARIDGGDDAPGYFTEKIDVVSEVSLVEEDRDGVTMLSGTLPLSDPEEGPALIDAPLYNECIVEDSQTNEENDEDGTPKMEEPRPTGNDNDDEEA